MYTLKLEMDVIKSISGKFLFINFFYSNFLFVHLGINNKITKEIQQRSGFSQRLQSNINVHFQMFFQNKLKWI
jgi:hypothetical protein